MKLVGPVLPPVAHASVNESLKRAAAGRDGLRLVARDETETFKGFAELYDRARIVAAALMERGVQPGERVALVLPTGWDFIEAFYGVQLAGAVPVPLYPPVRLGRWTSTRWRPGECCRCRARAWCCLTGGCGCSSARRSSWRGRGWVVRR